jgi:uncharacterized protein DUF5321
MRRSQQVNADPNTGFRWTTIFRNPAVHVTFFAILCGSQAIHVIALKNKMADSDALIKRKIKLLNEVIGKIKAGEAVDVKAELGTGDPEMEKEWADGQFCLIS